MSRRPMTEEEKQAVSLRFKRYWAGRRQAKEAALVSPKDEVLKHKVGRPRKNNVDITTKIETVVKKPYVFATVTVTKGDQIMVGHGFAKWDNVAPAWNEDFGKQIAVGRAKKQIKREHGIVVK